MFESLKKRSQIKALSFALQDNPRFDSGSSKQSESDRRGQVYSDIIAQYQDNQYRSLKLNRRLKQCMFWICMGILGVLTVGFCIVVYVVVKDRITNDALSTLRSILTSKTDLTILITAMAPVITAYITLPNIIAKYLFAHSDEETMSQILTQLLRHDIENKKILNNVKNNLAEIDVKEFDNDDMVS